MPINDSWNSGGFDWNSFMKNFMGSQGGGNNRFKDDWWDNGKYEDILNKLFGTMNAVNVPQGGFGEQALKRSNEVGREALGWDWTSGGKSILDLLGNSSVGQNLGITSNMQPQDAYANLVLSTDPAFGGQGNLSAQNFLQQIQPPIQYGMQEKSTKNPIYGQMMENPFSAAGLSMQELFGSSGALQGWRAQDIDLLMQQLQMEQATAQAEGQSGGCVVTSACTQARNLPDDCYELQTLRKLRGWMKQTELGKKMVKVYEKYAPLIVEKIDALPNRKDHWEVIYKIGVMPAVKLTEEEKYNSASIHYVNMIGALADAYL